MSARQVCFGSRYLICRECPGCRFLTQRNACVNSGMCVAAEGMERHIKRHMVRYYTHEAVFCWPELLTCMYLGATYTRLYLWNFPTEVISPGGNGDIWRFSGGNNSNTQKLDGCAKPERSRAEAVLQKKGGCLSSFLQISLPEIS